MPTYESVESIPVRLLRAFLAVSLFLFLLSIPWFYGLTRFKDQRVAELVLCALLILAIPVLDVKRFLPFSFSKLDMWVCAGALLALIYWIFSAVPWESFIAIRRWTLGLLLYILVRTVVRGWADLLAFLWLLVVVAGGYAIYGLMQYYLGLPHEFWYQPESLASRFVNGSHFAALTLFGLFLSFPLMIVHRSWILRGGLMSLDLVMVWAMLLSRCRTAWIALAAGFLVFLFCLGRFKVLGRWKYLGVLAAVAVGGVALGFWKGWDLIWLRFYELWDDVDIKFYNLSYRFQLWEGSLLALLERPWGWGLGAFQAVIPKFRVHVDRFRMEYAHNDFIQWGVDFGVPGLIFLAAFLSFLFRALVRALKAHETDVRTKAVALGFLGLALSLCVASQADFALRIYALSLFAVVTLSLVASYLELIPRKVSPVTPLSSPPSFAGVQSFFRWAVFLVSSALFSLSATHLAAEIHFERGVKHNKAFEWGEAERSYRQATKLAPYDHRYIRDLGMLYQKRAGLSTRKEEKTHYRVRAIEALEKARTLQPYRGDIPYLLGFLYEESGDQARARGCFEAAMAMEPTNTLFVAEFGYFAIRNGMKREAVETFERYLTIPYRVEGAEVKPCDLVRDIYRVTQSYDDLKRVIPDLWEAHRCFGVFLAEKGRWDLAKKELDLALSQARAIMGLEYYHAVARQPVADMYVSYGRFEEALEIYRRAIEKSPDDTWAVREFQEITQQARPAGPSNIPS